jgi:hypothetical protein
MDGVLETIHLTLVSDLNNLHPSIPSGTLPEGVAGRGSRAEEGDNDERDGARHEG